MNRRTVNAQLIQCAVRSRIAKNKVNLKRREKAILIIQCLVRSRMARMYRKVLFCTAKVHQIIRWYKYWKNVLRSKASSNDQAEDAAGRGRDRPVQRPIAVA